MSFSGRFDFVSSENFDEYLKAVGVGFALRTLAKTAKPAIEIQETEGNYSLKTISTLKTTEIKFKLGEEFDEETLDGRKAKSTVTADGNKLIHTQRIGSGEAVTVREFSGDEMTATFTCKGVSAVRKYKKTG